MIYILLAYLLFLIAYDHWGTDTVTSQVIYFTVQWLFPAGVAFTKKGVKYVLVGVIFVGLAVNELSLLFISNAEYYEKIGGIDPVYGLTIIALALFLIYEIIRWKSGKNGI